MKKYITLFKMYLLKNLQYRAAAVAGISTQFAWGFMNVLLYDAFYRVNPAAFPMEFHEITAYIWLRQAFLALLNTWYNDGEVLEMITNGNIAYELVRPMDLYSVWFVRNASARLARAALRCAPILVIAAILPKPYGISLPANPMNALIFLLSLMLALVCVCSYNMIVYVMCCHTMNATGVRIVMQNIAGFFSGEIVPLPFLPGALRVITEYSPFGAMENLPYRIYSGNIAGGEMWMMLAVQIFWCAVLIVVGRIWMSATKKKIVIQGG